MKISPAIVVAALVVGAPFLSIQAAQSAKEVNLDSLLKEMVNRDALAQWPAPAYSLKEASSHDPSKKDPSDLTTWHNNADAGQFIRTETNEGRKEWVIMDDKGAGAITRYWTPFGMESAKQTIRFYFDGATTPSLALNYLDLFSGKGMVRPPLAFLSWNQLDVAAELAPDYDPAKVRAANLPGTGSDLYLPIGFAKSCKVTLDSVPFYYVINYRIYQPGTTVKTFTTAECDEAKPLIEKVGKTLLANPAEATSPKTAKSATLAPDQSVTVDLRKGSAAVRELEVQIDPNDAPQVLRSIIVEATFDDEKTIWCPIGDFFGTGVRLNPVHDWNRTVEADGKLTARWVMPYQHTGQISLHNVGSTPVKVKLVTVATPWKWNDRSMLFHATWHSDHGIPTIPRSDWNYIEITGRGIYVGDTLTVYNPVPAWYGEGDESIYVDGERIPSMIGTGTEDYYGCAWGMPDYFSSPFLSTPKRDHLGRESWVGYTTDSRMRLLDGIPFEKSLKHNMEIWSWATTQVDYAVGTFWYAFPGATSNREPQPDEARMAIKEKIAGPGEVTISGAIECESLVKTLSPGTNSDVQDGGLAQGGWSGGKQLFVKAGKVGDFVELTIPVGDDKPRTVTLYATKSTDYGILRFSLNGATAGKDFDAYATTARASGPIVLGTATPKDGKIVFRAEVTGTNPSSTGAHYYFGLDCFTLGQP